MGAATSFDECECKSVSVPHVCVGVCVCVSVCVSVCVCIVQGRVHAA